MITRVSTSWTAREIQLFLRRARPVFKSEAFDVRLAPAQGPYTRILIVTPRKMGTAPQRNKFRRRVKAIFYEQGLSSCGFDVAIFSKKPANLLSFSELQALLLTIMSMPNQGTGCAKA
jgi:ribonuclease P protein component